MWKLTLSFFWRYDYEKWIWILLEAICELSAEEKIFSQINFHFFWKWAYKEKIQDLSKKFNNIVDHWRKDRNYIKNFLKEKSDYTIMPSIFLETFGKTFLESCEIWIPVIWLKKWWSAPFIHEDLDINAENHQKIKERLVLLIKKILNNNWKHNRQFYQERSFTIAQNFSKDKRIDNFKHFFPAFNNWKTKIILTSDYSSNIGWIEQYLQDTKKILSQEWMKIKIFWRSLSTWRYTKILKWFYLCLSWLNIVYFVQFYLILLKEKPNCIWFHSTLRVIWWLPLYLLPTTKKILVTYHDLWYFHPFPSLVEKEAQIPLEFSLKSFLSTIENKSLLKKWLIILKFFSLSLIKNQLIRKAQYHIVPSDFMVKFLEEQRKIPKEKIIVFPHCSVQ